MGRIVSISNKGKLFLMALCLDSSPVGNAYMSFVCAMDAITVTRVKEAVKQEPAVSIIALANLIWKEKDSLDVGFSAQTMLL